MFIHENKILIKSEVNQIATLISVYNKKAYLRIEESLKEHSQTVNNIATVLYTTNKNKKNKNEIIEEIKELTTIIAVNEDFDFIYFEEINSSYKKSKINFLSKKQVEIKEEDYFDYYNKNLNENYKCYYKYFKTYKLIINMCKNSDQIKHSVQKNLLENLSSFIQDNKKYLFIINKDKQIIYHKNQRFINKKTHKKTIDKIFKTIANEKNYLSYENIFIANGEYKTSYVKEIKELQWIIGIGFEHDSLKKEIKKYKKDLKEKNSNDILFILIFSIIIIFFLLLSSFYISKILKNKFVKYKTSINNQILLNKEKELLLIQQSKMSLMGEMIACISHQWKQPLNRINGLNYLISLKTKNNNVVKEYVEEIENNTKYLNNTMNYFSDFFKPVKDKKNFYIRNAVSNSLTLLDSKIKKYNVIINLEGLGNKKTYGQEQEYIQIILVLLNNSIDSFINNNIKNPRILIKSEIHKNDVYLIIEDNAGGIPKDKIDKIFDIWFTTKKNNNGTGLGLYMARFICENAMNGTLSVIVKDDKTSFTIKSKGVNIE